MFINILKRTPTHYLKTHSKTQYFMSPLQPFATGFCYYIHELFARVGHRRYKAKLIIFK